jgi:hypothetical protein
MAKKSAPPDDGRVTVIAGSGFKHDGKVVWPNDVVRMTPRDAADMKALRFVRDPKPSDADRIAAFMRARD